MLRSFLPFWRHACVALVCTALLFAVWLPHILKSAVEELKRRRLENLTLAAAANNNNNNNNNAINLQQQQHHLHRAYDDETAAAELFQNASEISRSLLMRLNDTFDNSLERIFTTLPTTPPTTSSSTSTTRTKPTTTRTTTTTTTTTTTMKTTTKNTLLWAINTTLRTTTSATLTTLSRIASTTSTLALPLAVVSTMAPLTTQPVAAYTMSEDAEYLPKMMYNTPTTGRLTIAKLALALNRINNVPMKWCVPDVEEKLNFNCHRAVRNVGDIRILQRTIMDVVNGRKDKVIFGAVGGSVTAGHDVQHHQLYVNRMASVFSRALDVPTVTEVAAMSATGSEYFAYCLHKMFDMRRLDIMAVEFCINDDRFKDYQPGYQPDKGRPMEELVRQVLQYENVQPIMVCFRQVKTLVQQSPDEQSFDPDCQSIEDTDFLPLAAYYALPLISWKKVFCRSELRRNISAFVAPDGVHPNAMVHEHIGEFYSLLLKYAIEDLIGKLLSRYPSYAQPWNLPRPFTMETAPGLYRSTWMQLRPICFINFERRDSGFSVKSLMKAVTHSQNITLIGTSGPLHPEDVLEYYEVHGANSSVTFSFQFDRPASRPELELVLSLAYQTMSSCIRDGKLRISISAKPSFFGNSRFGATKQNSRMTKVIQTNMPIRCYDGYHANMVDEIPLNDQLDQVNELIALHGNLILTIEKPERYYPLTLHAVVAGWRKVEHMMPVF